MNKLFTKIAALVLGMTMAVGVGVAVGSGVKASEVNAASITWPGTKALPGTATAIGTGVPVTIKTSSTNTYTNPIRVYANNTITIAGIEGATLDSITYEASSTGNYVTYAKEATVTPSVTPTVSGKNVTWTLDAGITEFTFKPASQTRSNGITVVYSTAATTTYTVTVNVNNSNYGTVSQSSVANVAADTSISVSGNTLTVGTTNVTASPKSSTSEYDFSFSDWSGVPSAGKVTSDITVVANFIATPKAFTVLYNENGATSGTVPVDENEYESGDEATILGNTGNLEKEGFNWAGWALNAEGTGTVYGPSYTTSIEVTESITFYAKWDEKALTSISASGTAKAKAGSSSWNFDDVTIEGFFDYSETGIDITSNCAITSSTAVPTTLKKNVTVNLSVSYKGGTAFTTESVSGYTYNTIEKTAAIVFDDNGSSDSNAEISSNDLSEYITEGNSYFSNASGISKTYKGITGLKFGSSKANGSITLNLQGLSDFSSAKLYLTAKQWGTDSSSLAVTSSQLASSTSTGTLTSELVEYEVGTFNSAPTSITIDATSRAYLKSIVFKAEEIVVPTDVTSLTVNDGTNDHTSNFNVSLYENTEATYTATVLPASAEQSVNWTSTGNIVNDGGYFMLGSYSEGTTATLTATTVGTTSSGDPISITVSITILEDTRELQSVAIGGDWSSKVYYDGDDWDSSSLTYTGVFDKGDPVELPTSDVEIEFYSDEGCIQKANKASTGMTSVWVYAFYSGTYGEAEGLKELTFPAVLAKEATYTRTDASKTSFKTTDTFTYGGTVTETWNYDPEHPNTYTQDDSQITFAIVESNGDLITNIAVGDSMLIGYNNKYVSVMFNGNQVGETYSITVAETFDKTKGEYHLAASTQFENGAADGLNIIIAAGYDANETSIEKVMGDYGGGNNFPEADGAKNISKGIVTKTNGTNLTLEAGTGDKAGYYLMKNDDGQYLYAAGGTSKNYLKASSEITPDDKFYFSFEYVSDYDWTIQAKDESTTRNTIRYNSSSKLFSCYSSGQSDVTVYVFNTYEDEIFNFASEFTNGLAEACKDKDAYNKEAVSALWGTYKTKFEALTDSTINPGKNAQGLFATSSEAKVVQARTLYLHIVSRYGLSVWTGAPSAATRANPISIFGTAENSNVIAIVVIVSVVSLTAIGGYFFLRKKREQN